MNVGRGPTYITTNGAPGWTARRVGHSARSLVNGEARRAWCNQARTIMKCQPLWLTLLVLGAMVTPVPGCRRSQWPPIVSPSGAFSLVVSVNKSKAVPGQYYCLVFTVYDANEKVIDRIQTDASDRLKWNVAWDTEDRIWLDSADIGTYYWELGSNGRWQKYALGDKRPDEKTPRPPPGIQ